tara:strand:- start:83 stop:541 length:459 start_codon:yes stop_codon:yes gene_type:complete
MSKIVIGIDPDSDKHGVAIYKDGVLHDLLMNDLMSLMDTLTCNQRSIDFESSIVVHIENVCGNNTSSFNQSSKFNRGVNSKISEKVGMCKQAQKEVEKLCKHLGIEVVHHRVSKQWKSGPSKSVFKSVTGWTGKSNEDSRSAAYFGWLGVTS